ncbi:hypothetical protein I6F15_04435 [Bradyrhizobium sp. BRP14]|nr:hypothetical protein [Bradyrhizobium sp. BRP14]
MEERVKVKVKAKSQVYIHNDLANNAYYLRKKIHERLAKEDTDGISLEMTACLIMIAFALEAQINFLGWKLITDWNERSPALEKLQQVAKLLGVDPNFETRPFSTAKRLKEFRDGIAHGKPFVITVEDELVATYDELHNLGYKQAPWEGVVTAEFLDQAYDDMETIWHDLLKRSGLEVFDTLTHHERDIEFIGPADAKD